MTRKFRSLAKKLIYGFLPGTSGSFPYYGSSVFFPRGASAFAVVCDQGVYEQEIVRLIMAFIKPHSTMFDVGANIGLMALPALHSCSSCSVISFEPSPSSIPYLKKTIAESVYRDRWSLKEMALAAKQGEHEFCVGSAATALFEGFRSGRRMPDAHTIRVPVSTLDQEWEILRKPKVSLLKIDVEGAEEGVFAGAQAMLQQCRPCVITEWHEPYLREFGTRPTYLFDVGQQFGYEIFGASNGASIENRTALQFQMLYNANFALVPKP